MLSKLYAKWMYVWETTLRHSSQSRLHLSYYRDEQKGSVSTPNPGISFTASKYTARQMKTDHLLDQVKLLGGWPTSNFLHESGAPYLDFEMWAFARRANRFPPLKTISPREILPRSVTVYNVDLLNAPSF